MRLLFRWDDDDDVVAMMVDFCWRCNDSRGWTVGLNVDFV